MSTVIASTSFATLATPASASILNTQKSSLNYSVSKASAQELIKKIQPYVVVDADGKLSLSPSVPKEPYNEYHLDMLEKRFKTLNKGVAPTFPTKPTLSQ